MPECFEIDVFGHMSKAKMKTKLTGKRFNDMSKRRISCGKICGMEEIIGSWNNLFLDKPFLMRILENRDVKEK